MEGDAPAQLMNVAYRGMLKGLELVLCMIPQSGDKILLHMSYMAKDGKSYTEYICFKKVSKDKNRILNQKFQNQFPELWPKEIEEQPPKQAKQQIFEKKKIEPEDPIENFVGISSMSSTEFIL